VNSSKKSHDPVDKTLPEEVEGFGEDMQDGSRQHDSKYPDRITGLKNKHKKHLEFSGKRYEGVTENPNQHDVNATKCDSCHKTTNNNISLECNACGWTICAECGVCRCDDFPF
jgi:hypothetical protein